MNKIKCIRNFENCNIEFDCKRWLNDQNSKGIGNPKSYITYENTHTYLSHISHFYVILNDFHEPWVLANRFLKHKAFDFYQVKSATLVSLATDLAYFKNWVDEEDIDFLAFPKRKHARPTYKFCMFLIDKVELGEVSGKTARRKMSSVQQFYRWLQSEGYEFENSLWLEKNFSVRYQSSKGFGKNKTVTTTDLVSHIKKIKRNNSFNEYIVDGSKLKPLEKDEQVAIVKSLNLLNNTEMKLAFLLALCTGARLQTIFTLRRQCFELSARKNSSYTPLKVGRGTLVDTKGDKNITLLIPNWLYKKIQVYLKSPRFRSRLKRCPYIQNDGEEYLFLTKAALPYYIAQKDPFITQYEYPPRGNAVTQFIKRQLLPKLLEEGFDFNFKFHDMRATFGLNLLSAIVNERGLKNISDETSIDYFTALNYVKKRMGHESIATTEQYLKYQSGRFVVLDKQNDYEIFIRDLSND